MISVKVIHLLTNILIGEIVLFEYNDMKLECHSYDQNRPNNKFGRKIRKISSFYCRSQRE